MVSVRFSILATASCKFEIDRCPYRRVMEVRECLESLGEILAKADAVKCEQAQESRLDLTVLTNEELWALESLLAKAGVRETMGGAAEAPALQSPNCWNLKPWRELPRDEPHARCEARTAPQNSRREPHNRACE